MPTPSAPPLDLGHLLASLSTGALSSRDVDLLELHGGSADEPHKARLDWQSLGTRGLTTAPGSAGGYLVQESVGAAAAALRPASVVIASGAEVIEASDNLILPTVATPITAGWILSGDSLTETTPVLGAVAARPHWLGGYIEATRGLLRQGPAVSGLIARELTAAVATAIDKGALQGAGSGAEPLGLVNVAGIGTASGAGLTYGACLTAAQTVLAAGGNESTLGWATTPAVATILKSRARLTGADTPIINGQEIAGYPVRISANCPTGTLALVDWSTIAVVVFGPILVEVNPTANFRAGITGFRILIGTDVVARYPSAIYTLTSVS